MVIMYIKITFLINVLITTQNIYHTKFYLNFFSFKIIKKAPIRSCFGDT